MDSVFLDDFSDPGGCVSGGYMVDGAEVLKPVLTGLLDYIRADGREKTVLSGAEPRINHEDKLSIELRGNKEKKA